MTTEAYVRDPRFEAHGVGVREENAGGGYWFDEPNFRKLAANWNWSQTACLCHHAAFDGLILSHHYGIKPARWLDTYSMAAYLFPNAPKSLEALAQRFGLSAKTVPYDKIKGKHWAELGAETRVQLAEGCIHDCELTYTIFQKMMSGDY
jgi:DNA polymerase III epsilon subunit-like protein